MWDVTFSSVRKPWNNWAFHQEWINSRSKRLKVTANQLPFIDFCSIESIPPDTEVPVVFSVVRYLPFCGTFHEIALTTGLLFFCDHLSLIRPCHLFYFLSSLNSICWTLWIKQWNAGFRVFHLKKVLNRCINDINHCTRDILRLCVTLVLFHHGSCWTIIKKTCTCHSMVRFSPSPWNAQGRDDAGSAF